MDRIEAIIVLVEAESRERLKERKNGDFVAALYEVWLEAGEGIEKIMEECREEERR
jgi:hypothetical protein